MRETRHEEIDHRKHLPLEILPNLTNPRSCPRPSSTLLALPPPAAARRRKGSGDNRRTRAETEDGAVLVLVVPFLVDKRAFAREEGEAIALVVHVEGEAVPAGREKGGREVGRVR